MSTESIPVTVNGKVAIVTAPGYVNEKSAEAISEECSGLINDGVSLVLIDMRDCRMVNSVGVAIIIEIIEVLGEHGGRRHSSRRCGAQPAWLLGRWS